MARAVRVRAQLRGVREVLKSDGVASMLGGQAERAAAHCNSLCDPQLKRAGARYVAETVQRRFTAGGLVRVGGEEDGKFARIDNYRNNTLKKGCGV